MPDFALADKTISPGFHRRPKTADHHISQQRAHPGQDGPQVLRRVSAQIYDPPARIRGAQSAITFCN
jgi:hypothetical protein